jgi:predicted nucleic-acid-binding protein
MLLVDTNIILRYLLSDNSEQSPIAKKIIENEPILLLTQVVAECVYVLEKVYKAEKSDVSENIKKIIIMKNIQVENKELISLVINEYGVSNLDFVDLLLWANNKLYGFEIKTFDKPLAKKLGYI